MKSDKPTTRRNDLAFKYWQARCSFNPLKLQVAAEFGSGSGFGSGASSFWGGSGSSEKTDLKKSIWRERERERE